MISKNVRRIKSTLLLNSETVSYYIIALSETWLTPDIVNNDYIRTKYSVYLTSRNLIETDKSNKQRVLMTINLYLYFLKIDLSFIYSTLQATAVMGAKIVFSHQTFSSLNLAEHKHYKF